MTKDLFIDSIVMALSMAAREGLIITAMEVKGETFGVEEITSPYGKVKILKND